MIKDHRLQRYVEEAAVRLDEGPMGSDLRTVFSSEQLLGAFGNSPAPFGFV